MIVLPQALWDCCWNTGPGGLLPRHRRGGVGWWGGGERGVLSGEALVAMARQCDAEDARGRDHITRTRGIWETWGSHDCWISMRTELTRPVVELEIVNACLLYWFLYLYLHLYISGGRGHCIFYSNAKLDMFSFNIEKSSPAT